jgi:hypothetical protein
VIHGARHTVLHQRDGEQLLALSVLRQNEIIRAQIENRLSSIVDDGYIDQDTGARRSNRWRLGLPVPIRRCQRGE